MRVTEHIFYRFPNEKKLIQLMENISGITKSVVFSKNEQTAQNCFEKRGSKFLLFSLQQFYVSGFMNVLDIISYT